jgi:hypothetical protein
VIVFLPEYGGSMVSEDDIIRRHGKRGFKKFTKWMDGQTKPLVNKKDIIKLIPEPDQWVYWEDYARWVKGWPVVD